MSLKFKILFITIAIAFVVVIWLGIHILGGYLLLGSRPPAPSITRGEFDFRLEYEMNGERIVIEDTIIVEFDGFSTDAGAMAWYRTWRLHLASDRQAEHLLLLVLDDGRRMYYNLGNPNYYMSDMSVEWSPPYFNGVFIIQPGMNTSRENREGLTHVALYEDFGIRLISWEHDPPITNTFR